MYTQAIYIYSVYTILSVIKEAKMTTIGAATKAMCNAICKDTYYRAKKWFSEHPDVEVAYWAKDDFLPFCVLY